MESGGRGGRGEGMVGRWVYGVVGWPWRVPLLRVEDGLLRDHSLSVLHVAPGRFTDQRRCPARAPRPPHDPYTPTKGGDKRRRMGGGPAPVGHPIQ